MFQSAPPQPTPQETPAAADKEENSGTDTGEQQGKVIAMNLYFATLDNSAVPKEKREVTVKDGAVMRAAIEALLEGPKSSELRKTIPDGTKLLGIKRDGSTAVVDFSKEYTQVNGVAEIVENTSVVNTLTEIQGIEKVKILVEGKDLIAPSGMPYGEMSRVALDAQGRPASGEMKTLTLYFGNSNADAVVAEKREVAVTKGGSLEKAIFQELMKGPKTKGLEPVIPKGTKLLSVETKDGLCTLNLSKEFIDNSPGGTAAESMTINSVVNSLTGLANVKKVQFLIEGKKRETYTHVIFDQPFSRNEAIIQK